MNTTRSVENENMHCLGKLAKDKITGFEGIVVARVAYITGCDQYGLAPKAENGNVGDTHYFDVGRVEIIGDGIDPKTVQAAQTGGVNRDAPGI